jgi:hypothetical protein
MTKKGSDWDAYFTKALKDAETELANFESAVAKHGLRVRHKDKDGERDVTEQNRRALKHAVEEYRAALRD